MHAVQDKLTTFLDVMAGKRIHYAPVLLGGPLRIWKRRTMGCTRSPRNGSSGAPPFHSFAAQYGRAR